MDVMENVNIHQESLSLSLLKEEENKGNDKVEMDDVERQKNTEINNEGKVDYKQAFNALVDYITNPQPKYEYRTDKAIELQHYVSAKYDQAQRKIEGKQEDEHYFDAILNYLELNGTGYQREEVIKIQNGSGKQNIIDQSDLLQVYIIQDHKRMPKLNGQQGLKAMRMINEGSVIGEYFGIEYLEQEFDAIYEGTKEMHEINAYAFTEHVDVELDVGLINYFTYNEAKKPKEIELKSKKRAFLEFDDGNHNNHNNKNGNNVKRRKLDDGKNVIGT